jgi:hypothetical protein
METTPLTKESFLKHMCIGMPSGKPLYYCYICEEIFKTKTAQCIYGQQAEIPFEEVDKLWEKMWRVILAEQEKNPKLTYILVTQRPSDES